MSSTCRNQHTGLCVACSTGSPRIPIFTYYRIHITSLQTNNQSWTLIHRVKALCDQDSITQELELLTTVFKENGYSPQQIQAALKPVTRTVKTNERPTLIAFIPYTQTTYDRLSRTLAKRNIKNVSLPPRKSKATFHLSRMLWDLRTLGV